MGNGENQARELLDSGHIHTVIVASIDLQGRPFGKRLSSQEFLRVLEVGTNVSSCALGWDFSQSVGMQVSFTGYHTGWHDIRLVPDLATLRRLAWLDGTAFAFGDLFEIGGKNEISIAPRTILRRQQAALASAGRFAQVGTELEFFLFEGDYESSRSRSWRELKPTPGVRSQDLINRATNSLEPFFRQLRSSLIESGIEVAFSRSEWGRGQWEINIHHHNPMEMADRQCLLKMACKDIAHAFGLSASFMARPSAADVGSSCHVHCSLHDANGLNLLREGSVDTNPLLRHAIGGVLTHLPDLMLWYAPTINSYRRTASKQFAGNGRTWGIDNRTTTCRVCGDGTDARRFEFRVPGADANPHLLLAAVLAATEEGLRRRLDPGPRCEGDAYAQAQEEVLPTALEHAIRHFEQSDFTRNCFGEQVVHHYSEHARFEVAEFNSSVTDWELERYFESV
ncbi:glutamine synthetase family protein [Aquabacterium sp. CECT 9606]|uniref:glutamine synthetase family protein n=1 Tax=Aquabacterium sp. CECT 9606 TaxID=2845822 RepID=UPI001E3BEA51|nr:glutamine synthetase family protein [Aquabacterium sp. CECT 9606]CAH0353131.1 Glutamate--isopropylamine ligase [Aquabacterium sp. CECT 9606]